MEKLNVKPQNLHNATSFDVELFRVIKQRQCTQIEAFDLLNKLFTEAYNRPRYASYTSYLVTRAQRLKTR